MLSRSIWFSVPSFWMGGGLESRTVHSVSQDHHPSKNSVQKTICCYSTSNAPDDGRMYPKHVQLRTRQQNYVLHQDGISNYFSTFCIRKTNDIKIALPVVLV